MSTPQPPHPPNPPGRPRKNLRLLPDWERIPGTARRFRNVRTGETLSRRQYDQIHGRIAESGYHTDKELRDARRSMWKGFFQESFPVEKRGIYAAWQKLLARIKELGAKHRRAFVSAHGEAGYDYPDRSGEFIWSSTPGFYTDMVVATAQLPHLTSREPQPVTQELIDTGEPGLYAYDNTSEWLWLHLTSGYLRGNTIDEFVLRWQA